MLCKINTNERFITFLSERKCLCRQNHDKTVDVERQVEDNDWMLRLDTPVNAVICSPTKAYDAMWLLSKQRLQEGDGSKSDERIE